MFGNSQQLHTFEDYIYSLSNEARLTILNSLSKCGNPNQVLGELFSIPPCCQTKKNEFRINQNYLLRYRKKTLLKEPQPYLYRLESMKTCYYSCCRNGDYSIVGWITHSGERGIISGLEQNEAAAVYNELHKYVRGFDQLPGTPVTDGELMRSFDALHYYYFQGNTLYSRKYGEITKKITDTVCIPNIQDLIWCDQWYTWDSEASDSYALDIYLLHQKRSFLLFSNSESDAFSLAMELKKRVPHLMYEPNEEYKKIFKRDPAELMALAKSKNSSV